MSKYYVVQEIKAKDLVEALAEIEKNSSHSVNLEYTLFLNSRITTKEEWNQIHSLDKVDIGRLTGNPFSKEEINSILSLVSISMDGRGDSKAMIRVQESVERLIGANSDNYDKSKYFHIHLSESVFEELTKFFSAMCTALKSLEEIKHLHRRSYQSQYLYKFLGEIVIHYTKERMARGYSKSFTKVEESDQNDIVFNKMNESYSEFKKQPIRSLYLKMEELIAKNRDSLVPF